MKKSILSSILMLSALSFTSCLNSDEGNKSEATLTYGGSYCFNRVTDMQTGESFISTEPQYSFLLNYTENLITPSMSNIRLNSADGSALAFKLPALKVNVGMQDYSYTCNGSDLTPEGQTQAYIFDRFSFKVIDRAIKTSNGNYLYSPVYDINYSINNRYSVIVFPTRYDLLGITSSIADGSDTYTTKDAIYSILLDPKTQKANITIQDARFASGHAYMRIGVKDLPYTITGAGISIITEQGQKIQLYDNAGEVKGAYLSDLNLRINVPSGNASSISFHANIVGLQGSSQADEYDVVATLSYYVPTSED